VRTFARGVLCLAAVLAYYAAAAGVVALFRHLAPRILKSLS
jgi:hypothetical protein